MSKRPKRIYSIQSDYMDQYEMQQKREKRRKTALIRRLVVAGIAMFLLTVLVAHYHIGQRTVYSEKVEQYELLQSELAELKKVEAQLSEEIDLLNDEAYILDIARTNYFLSKEGELIFQLEDIDSSY
ncbi:MAG TPA: septum formation initiator family protein [Pseudogracilibacillus sp.]|nr:septum formation initiator family protein [Pseudogracilibacillus sp.]